MRAIICTRYGPPEVLRLGEVADPVPKRNEVLIRIHATAVTASDGIIRRFEFPVWHPTGLMMGLVFGFKRPRNPILGMVLAGEVESTGREVERFRRGDRVFGWTPKSPVRPQFGTYAELKCLPEDSVMASMPSNLSYEEAAAIPYGGLLASYYLGKGDIRDGQRILIYGASGSVGVSAVQLAKYCGARVTGVCSTSNLELVRSLGADDVIDYTRDDITNRADRYDLVFDAVGKKKSSELKLQSREALTAEGKWVSVDDGLAMATVKDLELLTELVEAGHLKPVIDRRYPLEQMVEAHRYVDQGHKKGNVVITVTPDAGA